MSETLHLRLRAPYFYPTSWLAFDRGQRVPAVGGDTEFWADEVGGSHIARWSRDGTRLFFLRTDETGRHIWVTSVANREERRLTALEGKRGVPNSYALATDGHYLYFTWEEDLGDIWVMDVVKDEEK